MNEDQPIKYSDLLQADDSFDVLLSKLEEVREKYSAIQSSIASSAQKIKDSLAAVNSTTGAGREVIAGAAKDVQALARKEQELANMYTETSRALVQKNAELRRARNIAKLEQKAAESAVGSYDNLSARYNLIKLELNGMTKAQRESTEVMKGHTKSGKELEEEALQLYNEMKRLQEVTGKHTLAVGDYGIATINLASDIRRAVQALTQMRLEGKQGTDEYLALTKTLQKLKTEYSIVKTETQSLGSQTRRLNQVMGALSSTSGALTAATGALTDAEGDWAQGLLRVNKMIAITNGLMAFVNGLYKQSAVTTAILTAQKKAEVVARALNIKSLKTETKLTLLQTVAMKALNAVSKANPYVLLGTAIVGAAMGIALLTKNTEKGKRSLESYNAEQKRLLDYAKQIAAIKSIIPQGQIDDAQRLMEIYQELGNSEQQLVELQQGIYEKRMEMLEDQAKAYDINLDTLEDDIAQERAALQDYLTFVNSISQSIYEAYGSKGKKPKGTMKVVSQEDFESKPGQLPEMPELGLTAGIFIKTADVEDQLKAALEPLQDKLNIKVGILTDLQNLQKEMMLTESSVAKTQLEVNKKIATQEAQLTTERFAQRAKLLQAEANYEIEALKQRLLIENNMSKEQQEYIASQILYYQQKLNNDLADVYYQRRKANIQATRETEDEVMKAQREGFEKRRALIIQSYAREREDLEVEIRNNASITATERTEYNKRIAALAASQAEELAQLAREQYKDLLDITRTNEDLIMDSKADSYAKDLEALKISNDRAKQDIQERLDFEALTAEQRKALQDQLIALDKKYAQERKLIELNLNAALLNNEKDLWSYRKDSLNEYTIDYLDAISNILNIEEQLAKADFSRSAIELGLSDADVQKGLDDITFKYNAERLRNKQDYMMKVFDLDQELAESEFNILRHSEYQKKQFSRKQEIERYKEMLKLNDEYGNMLTEKEVEIIKNRIKALENQPPEYSDFWDLLGIPSEWKDLLQDLVDKILDAYQEILDARMELAEAMTAAAEKEVSAAESALQAERQARANGYANNVALAKKELEESKKREREALEFKRKVQEEQNQLDSIQQVSSLVTATANFWSTSSSLGPIAGPIAAGIATAAMWTAFLYAKIKAAQIRKEADKYGEGTVELLQGGSHASGNDISLGVNKSGKERRAEGGEYLIIINKRNSRKYGDLIPEVANAFNTGSFETSFHRARDPRSIRLLASDLASGPGPSLIPGLYAAFREFTAEHGRTMPTDLSRIEADLSALRAQMDRHEYVEADGTRVIRNGNNTRRIKNG